MTDRAMRESLRVFRKEIFQYEKEYLPAEFRDFLILRYGELFVRIVRRTPVETGHLLQNWRISVGTPSRGILEGGDKTGDATIAAGFAALRQLPTSFAIYSATIFIQNHVPYASVIERGGFVPTNPGPSTQRGHKGEILVRGGFSVKAPQGMLGVSLQEVGARDSGF